MDNKEFFAAFDDLCKEKGISKEEFIETLKNALNSAYKKQYDGGAEVFVDIDPEKGIFECNAVQKVVAEVTDRDKEISVEEAQAINPEYREGDEIVHTFVPQDFGRIAAQTAKQVILQKLREKERDNTFSAMSDKEGELLEATVRKIDDKNVYVDFADRKIEGVMLPQDQSPTETYAPKDVIKVFVRRVKNGGRNSQVLVSRTAPGLVKKLFEQQVPEIAQGLVEVKSVSREAGHRTKMAIYSSDSRVTNEKGAVAVVPDDKLSLAIGRDGQNARLAARLTGWKIDVKDYSTAEKLGLLAYDEETNENTEAEQENPEATTDPTAEDNAAAETNEQPSAEEEKTEE